MNEQDLWTAPANAAARPRPRGLTIDDLADPGPALVSVAVRRGPRGFTFDDLAVAGRHHGGRVSALAEWLAQARSSGLVEDLGFDVISGLGDRGPRRYRIAQQEREELAG